MKKNIYYFLVLQIVSFTTNAYVICMHEHELRQNVNIILYEKEVIQGISQIHIPGLLRTFFLKGGKGIRKDKYAVVWIFDNFESLDLNFGTLENPKCPPAWLYYENEILTKYLIGHPDKIYFTDYGIIADWKQDETANHFFEMIPC